MFTGLIEATSEVLELKNMQLAIERPQGFDDIKIGSSIAVSGVCLSIVAFDERSMTFDLVQTTVQKTKLGKIRAGDRVNLERAMRADGRFEGHIVQGHVEGVGRVGARARETMLTISCPSSLLPSIIPEGSITLDGVSLTVAKLKDDQVTVALIPHTLEHTTLGGLQERDKVNIETDILFKYALKRL